MNLTDSLLHRFFTYSDQFENAKQKKAENLKHTVCSVHTTLELRV